MKPTVPPASKANNVKIILVIGLTVICQFQHLKAFSLGKHKDSTWDQHDSSNKYDNAVPTSWNPDDVMSSDMTWHDDEVQSDMTWHDDILTEDDILTDGWNGVPRGCGGKPAEVYFVLDTSSTSSSSSGPSSSIHRQKSYLSDLLAVFHLGNSATRVGLLSYGQKTELVSSLGADLSVKGLRETIESAPSVGGNLHIAQVLKYLRVHGFSKPVARREVAHVVIVMTSGQTGGDFKQAVHEADLLKKQGVYLYFVSDPASEGTEALVENSGDRDLAELSSVPTEQFTFTTSNWDIVDSLINLLRIKECNYQVLPPLPGKEAVCTSRRPTEIAFALDHLALGGTKTKILLSYIQNMLAEIDPSSDIKAAILTSRDPMSRRALSRQVETIDSVERRLGGVVFPDLAPLLKQAKKTLNRGARTAFKDETNDVEVQVEDVQKVLVVFMDNSVQPTKASLSAAKTNHRYKIDTYVVYVAEDTESDEAKSTQELVAQLASGDDHVIRVKSYEDLQDQSVVIDTLATVCRGL